MQALLGACRAAAARHLKRGCPKRPRMRARGGRAARLHRPLLARQLQRAVCRLARRGRGVRGAEAHEGRVLLGQQSDVGEGAVLRRAIARVEARAIAGVEARAVARRRRGAPPSRPGAVPARAAERAQGGLARARVAPEPNLLEDRAELHILDAVWHGSDVQGAGVDGVLIHRARRGVAVAHPDARRASQSLQGARRASQPLQGARGRRSRSRGARSPCGSPCPGLLKGLCMEKIGLPQQLRCRLPRCAARSTNLARPSWRGALLRSLVVRISGAT
jgi:hypothetical protein